MRLNYWAWTSYIRHRYTAVEFGTTPGSLKSVLFLKLLIKLINKVKHTLTQKIEINTLIHYV